jgi:hypothetical protein
MENKWVTQAALWRVAKYDPDTGIFTRRINTGRHDCHKAGEVMGTKTVIGYIIIGLGNRRYMAHRLAWLYVHGEWPEQDLDHINRDKSDNRMANLRPATRLQNMQNVAKHKHNTSGVKGVCWHSQRNKWRAQINVLYRQKYLGLFDTFEAAVAARAAAEVLHHSHRVGK